MTQEDSTNLYYAEDIGNIDLKLDGLPASECLAVLIEDGQNPESLYRLRKIHVKAGSLPIEGAERIHFLDEYVLGPDKNGESYLNIEHLHLYDDRISCHEDEVEQAIRGLPKLESGWEREIAETPLHDQIKAALIDQIKTQAIAGVAKYTGQKDFSFENIVCLVGIKYHKMKSSYLS